MGLAAAVEGRRDNLVIRRLAASTVARNAAILYAVQIAGYLIALITIPYLARVLTPAKFGAVAYAQDFIWYFVVLTDYSFNLTATRRVAVAQDDRAALSRLFSTVMTAKLCLLVLGFGLLNIVLALVPKFGAEWKLYYLTFMTVASYVAFPAWYFQGLQKLQYVGARDLLSKLLVLGAVVTFVHGPSDYLAAAAIQSGALLVTGLAGLAALPWAAPVRFIRPSRAQVRDLFREGWQVFGSLFLANACPPSNVVILGLVASPVEVGIYSAASRIIFPLRNMVAPLVNAIYPHVSRLASQAPERALRFLRRYALLLSLPFLVLALGLVAFAPAVVRLLYGPQYADTTLLMRVMGASPWLLAMGHCYSTYFILAFGYDRVWARITAAGVACNFTVLAILLATLRPAVAVAATLVACDVFVLALSYRFYAARTGRGATSAAT
jgi:PST family polysaccharide transporter